MAIYFFTEEVSFKLKRKRKIKDWIRAVIAKENCDTGDVNIIFCSDEYLLQVNKTHLNHDYYTDIITFELASAENIVSGELYISVDRVFDNAKSLRVEKEEEMLRIIIHGILHLLGYGDKAPDEKAIMGRKENEALKMFHVEQGRGIKAFSRRNRDVSRGTCKTQNVSHGV